jgi:hypothetical protein
MASKLELEGQMQFEHELMGPHHVTQRNRHAQRRAFAWALEKRQLFVKQVNRAGVELLHVELHTLRQLHPSHLTAK